MKNVESANTLVVLANATELTARIAAKVLGNGIASTFAGAELTTGAIHSLAQSQFQAAVSTYLGDK
jgi:ABC-type amino acid transport system permease subunit